MEIIVDVVNQRLKLPTNLKDYVEGSQNFVKFNFKFDEDWDGLKIFAQFGQNGSTYNRYLDDENSVYLPNEIVNGVCTLCLYGSYENVIATTNHVSLRIDKGIVVDSSSTEISSSLYNQLVTQFVDLRSIVEHIENVGAWIEF